MGGLGEGEFLTAEERAAYLRRFEEENEEEESEQVTLPDQHKTPLRRFLFSFKDVIKCQR